MAIRTVSYACECTHIQIVCVCLNSMRLDLNCEDQVIKFNAPE